jgi:predicted N-acyltransferase
MVLRDFYDRDSTLFPFLTAAGFQKISNLPTTEFEIRWRDYDSYVGSMRSTYRSKLKRHRKIADQSRFTASFVSDFSDLGAQLSAQWKNVNKEAKEYSREELRPEFYTYINKGLKEKCRLLKIFQGNTLKAHALIAIDGGILRWLYFGRATKGCRDGAYFFALEQIIQLGIKLEMKKIEMGLTSYSAKTDYGAKMIPLYMFVQCRNRFLNQIVSRLYNYFNQPISVQNRNVFNE